MDDEDLVLYLTPTDMQKWEREVQAAYTEQRDVPDWEWHGFRQMIGERRHSRIDKKYMELAKKRRRKGGAKARLASKHRGGGIVDKIVGLFGR